jgi:hypothetical protein
MDKMVKRKKQYVIINEYQCPGFVDRSCSNEQPAPSLRKVGEKGGVR